MMIKQLLQQRLSSQQLTTSATGSVQTLVAYMGAVQSQDYGMAKWALGLRLKGVTDKRIDDAFNKGEILRTHVMRPTWHFVSPADIRWMLKLTASRIKAAMSTRERYLELDSKIFLKCNTILEKALRDHHYLTKTEIEGVFSAEGIHVTHDRVTHIMVNAELDGIVCSGPRHGLQFTYALLEERAAPAKQLTDDEALATLARKYFTSHGPATAHDFAWWAGLSVSGALKAIYLLGHELSTEKIAGQQYFFTGNLCTGKTSGKIYLLPNYDEYTVSYKDRSMLTVKDRAAQLPRDGNVLFSNCIMQNGVVIGMWKRTAGKKDVLVEPNLFKPLSALNQAKLQTAIKRYQAFMR